MTKEIFMNENVAKSTFDETKIRDGVFVLTY